MPRVRTHVHFNSSRFLRKNSVNDALHINREARFRVLVLRPESSCCPSRRLFKSRAPADPQTKVSKVSCASSEALQQQQQQRRRRRRQDNSGGLWLLSSRISTPLSSANSRRHLDPYLVLDSLSQQDPITPRSEFPPSLLLLPCSYFLAPFSDWARLYEVRRPVSSFAR